VVSLPPRFGSATGSSRTQIAMPSFTRRSAMTRRIVRVGFVATAGCQSAASEMIDTTHMRRVSEDANTSTAKPLDVALQQLSTRRVYFGHQSVGGNVLQGLQEILREHPDAALRVVESRELGRVSGRAFVHFLVGENENPGSKNADFLRVLSSRSSPDSALVLMKYCYIDVNDATDVDTLFGEYQRTVAQIRTRYPDVTVVHVTMPLTVDAAGPKAAVKRLLGRTTSREINARRSRFNEMMRREFSSEPIFDLATLEAERPDGSLNVTQAAGVSTYSLDPASTTDGGHLNDSASRRVAAALVRVLATVSGADR
jgi:hypothetical protein